MMPTQPWPNEFRAATRLLWQAGVLRAEIVATMQPEAQKLGRPLTAHTLNGFALRGQWGPHPLGLRARHGRERGRFSNRVRQDRAGPRDVVPARDRTTRRCLGCGLQFPSEGPNNRLCSVCK